MKSYKLAAGEYIVEGIIGRRSAKHGNEYLVKWLGYPESESTWEPPKHLHNVMGMVNKYNKEHSDTTVKITNPNIIETQKRHNPDPTTDTETSTIRHSDNDIILKVVQAMPSNNFEVEWGKRATGEKPQNSILNIEEIKKRGIVKLIDYYESKLEFNFN